jgi:hypothetical protein
LPDAPLSSLEAALQCNDPQFVIRWWQHEHLTMFIIDKP